MQQQYVNSLDESNLGPDRKVSYVVYWSVTWNEPNRCRIKLECGHQFDDVKVPHGFKMRKVYRCGQCRANSNHQI